MLDNVVLEFTHPAAIFLLVVVGMMIVSAILAIVYFAGVKVKFIKHSVFTATALFILSLVLTPITAVTGSHTDVDVRDNLDSRVTDSKVIVKDHYVYEVTDDNVQIYNKTLDPGFIKDKITIKYIKTIQKSELSEDELSKWNACDKFTPNYDYRVIDVPQKPEICKLNVALDHYQTVK